MDFFRNIPSPPAFPRPSSGRVDEARAPSFLVDVAGLSLVIAWTFVFWNGDGVGMAAAVCGSVDSLLALQSGATALFPPLSPLSPFRCMRESAVFSFYFVERALLRRALRCPALPYGSTEEGPRRYRSRFS